MAARKPPKTPDSTVTAAARTAQGVVLQFGPQGLAAPRLLEVARGGILRERAGSAPTAVYQPKPDVRAVGRAYFDRFMQRPGLPEASRRKA